MELWKDIEGFEGYRVSNYGEVKRNGKKIKSRITKAGYVIIELRKDKKAHIKYIHRLVASAFLPNEDDLPHVNHKDENRSNNYLDNLEWCTVEYNNSYGNRPHRLSISKMGHKRSEEAKIKQGLAIQGDKHWNYGLQWDKGHIEQNRDSQPNRRRVMNITTNTTYASMREAATLTGRPRTSISLCCQGKQHVTGGHEWRWCP